MTWYNKMSSVVEIPSSERYVLAVISKMYDLTDDPNRIGEIQSLFNVLCLVVDQLGDSIVSSGCERSIIQKARDICASSKNNPHFVYNKLQPLIFLYESCSKSGVS